MIFSSRSRVEILYSATYVNWSEICYFLIIRFNITIFKIYFKELFRRFIKIFGPEKCFADEGCSIKESYSSIFYSLEIKNFYAVIFKIWVFCFRKLKETYFWIATVLAYIIIKYLFVSLFLWFFHLTLELFHDSILYFYYYALIILCNLIKFWQ